LAWKSKKHETNLTFKIVQIDNEQGLNELGPMIVPVQWKPLWVSLVMKFFLKKKLPHFFIAFFFPLSQTYFSLVVFSYLVFLVAIFSSLPFFFLLIFLLFLLVVLPLFFLLFFLLVSLPLFFFFSSSLLLVLFFLLLF
jgi:hypothetical protein